MLNFNGIDIVVDRHRTKRVLHARSPARAKRRMKRGFPQCMRWVPDLSILQTPRGFVMHPAAYDALKNEVRSRGGIAP